MAPVLAGQYGPEGLEFPDGRPARNTPVLVQRLDGVPAALYADKERTTTAANPVTTDSYGNVSFLAAPGEYRLVVNGAILPILVPVHPLDPGFGVGGEGEGGYIHTQAIPASLVQIIHNLPWHPGGIQIIENSGDIVEPDSINYPSPGVIEIGFQIQFAGKVYLS
ncbi:MAG: hypothetical protein IPK85_02610 [Gemmatimonadetes bacterium]|nr:hypothetical protein [Gemmatimonadota bacterium]